jgi:hypothetical protein
VEIDKSLSKNTSIVRLSQKIQEQNQQYDNKLQYRFLTNTTNRLRSLEAQVIEQRKLNESYVDCLLLFFN